MRSCRRLDGVLAGRHTRCSQDAVEWRYASPLIGGVLVCNETATQWCHALPCATWLCRWGIKDESSGPPRRQHIHSLDWTADSARPAPGRPGAAAPLAASGEPRAPIGRRFSKPAVIGSGSLAAPCTLPRYPSGIGGLAWPGQPTRIALTSRCSLGGDPVGQQRALSHAPGRATRRGGATRALAREKASSAVSSRGSGLGQPGR